MRNKSVQAATNVVACQKGRGRRDEGGCSGTAFVRFTLEAVAEIRNKPRAVDVVYSCGHPEEIVFHG